jgi:hypothetical protein
MNNKTRKDKWFVCFALFLALMQLSFTHISECEELIKMLETEKDQHRTLQSFEFNFRESFETPAVRGIQKADYYSCNGKSGYLLVNRHNRALLFKDFPIDQWFEFKFANSPENFYSSMIKYNYVQI